MLNIKKKYKMVRGSNEVDFGEIKFFNVVVLRYENDSILRESLGERIIVRQIIGRISEFKLS